MRFREPLLPRLLLLLQILLPPLLQRLLHPLFLKLQQLLPLLPLLPLLRPLLCLQSLSLLPLLLLLLPLLSVVPLLCLLPLLLLVPLLCLLLLSPFWYATKCAHRFRHVPTVSVRERIRCEKRVLAGWLNGLGRLA